MKAYLLAGAALALLAAPAAARDNSAYFGLEIGPMWLGDIEVEDGDGDEVLDVDHSLGVDGDLIAGYDFGMVRAELELGHKWAKWNEFDVFDDGTSETFDADGHTRAYSAMVNAMADFGDNESVNFYAGAGVGMAWMRANSDDDDNIGDDFDIKDSNFAWQVIAGVRVPAFTHFDVGLKYRYFNGGRIEDDFEDFDVETGKWSSHSLLASLIYNFAPPAPPPPPPPLPPPAPLPPPPPATQVCPDGSVVLATDSCPMPPPPPPPPMPEPERG